jgi:hypothetical protein
MFFDNTLCQRAEVEEDGEVLNRELPGMKFVELA